VADEHVHFPHGLFLVRRQVQHFCGDPPETIFVFFKTAFTSAFFYLTKLSPDLASGYVPQDIASSQKGKLRSLIKIIRSDYFGRVHVR
jgi:hypothetical protein